MTVGPCMNCSSARLHCKPILFAPLNKALSVDKVHVSHTDSFHMPGTRSVLQGMSCYSPFLGICIFQLFLVSCLMCFYVPACLLLTVHSCSNLILTAVVLCSLHNVQCEFSCRAPGGGLSTPSETNRFTNTGHCCVTLSRIQTKTLFAASPQSNGLSWVGLPCLIYVSA